VQLYYFQPKVRVTFKLGKRSSGRYGQKIGLAWFGHFHLDNFTKYDAINLSVEHGPSFSLGLISGHLKGLEQREVKFTEMKYLSEEEFKQPANGDIFQREMPSALRSFYLLISYENEKNKTFYTLYKKSDSNDLCSFHRWRPRVKHLIQGSRDK
jgi:hypothetical protein